MIRRRHVYHLAGYDPVQPDAQYRRFARQLDIFRSTWNVDATLSELERSNDGSRAWWKVTARAADWQVEAVHEVLVWDDIVRGDFKRALPVRIREAAAAYLDFVATGTLFRYVKANLRYAIFFLVPIFQLALFAAGGWIVARLVIMLLGLTGIGAAAISLPIGFVVFYALLQWPGRRWRTQQLLDDWIFARDYLHGRRRDMDARLDRFADALVARAREAAADEIVLVGHSMGAMLAIDLLVLALDRDPDLGRRAASVCVLTVGATIPKFTLHPSAERARSNIARVVAESSIAWAEYQSRDDIISFYKFDPVALERTGDRPEGKPVIRRVQIHDMLLPETFARYRNKHLRLHYQSVMANDRRAPYDYFLMTCGPVPFRRWTISPQGLLDFVAADGSYHDRSRGRSMVAEQA